MKISETGRISGSFVRPRNNMPSFGLKMSTPLKSDSVSFSSKDNGGKDITAKFEQTEKFTQQLREKQLKNDMMLFENIVWELCPNIKRAAGSVMQRIIKAAKEEERLQEDFLADKITADEFLDAQAELKNEPQPDFLSFAQNVLTPKNINELAEAELKAQVIFYNYKENGIETVKDERLQRIIKEWEDKTK